MRGVAFIPSLLALAALPHIVVGTSLRLASKRRRQPDNLYFPLERFGVTHEALNLPIEPVASPAAAETVPEEGPLPRAEPTIVIPDEGNAEGAPPAPESDVVPTLAPEDAPSVAAPEDSAEPVVADEPKAKVIRETGPVPWDREGVQTDETYRDDYLHDKQPEVVEGSVTADKIIAENRPRTQREMKAHYEGEEIEPVPETIKATPEFSPQAATAQNEAHANVKTGTAAQVEPDNEQVSKAQVSEAAGKFEPFGWDTGEIQGNETYRADYPIDDQPSFIPKAD